MAPLPNLLAQPAQPAAATPASPVALATNTTPADQVLDISFDDLPLPEAIQQLVHLAGLTWQFDPALLNPKAADGTPIPLPTVKERWKNVSPLQALDALLDNYGWQMKRSSINPNLRITARPPGAVDPRTRKVNLLAAQDDEVLHDVAFDKMPVLDAIRQLAFLVPLNVQFDPQLLNPQDANHHPIPSAKPMPSPTVNEKWTNITARQAMQRLLDRYGWQTTQIPGNPILRIAAQDPH